MWTNSFLHFSVNYYSCYLFCCPFVWPLSAAHASWLLYHFLHDPIIFWVLQCFLAQNVLESSWTFSSWELEAISPRSQEALRSGAKRYYCSQAFSVDTHTDGLLSPLQHRLPMWTHSSSCLTFNPPHRPHPHPNSPRTNGKRAVDVTDPGKEKHSHAFPQWGQGAKFTKDSSPGSVTGGWWRGALLPQAGWCHVPKLQGGR